MWTEGDLCEWVLFSFSKITKNHENRSLCRFRAVNVGCPIILQPRDHFHWFQRGKRVRKSVFHHCFLQNGTFLDHTNGRTDEWTNGRTKVPLSSTGLCPLWGHCPAFHSNLQPCKAGERVSLTTYCPWATCWMSNRPWLFLSGFKSCYLDLNLGLHDLTYHLIDPISLNQKFCSQPYLLLPGQKQCISKL